MPRTARKKSKTGVYHVTLRGINRQQIFIDAEDAERFLQAVSDSRAISEFTLYAYCLMGNHVHLVLKEGNEPLEQIIKRIGVRFVYWYNWKYKRSGHLFQDRYGSEPVEDDVYLIAVVRYVHRNPVKAGICKRCEDYPYSSIQEYLDLRKAPYTQTEDIKAMMEGEDLETFFNTPTEFECLEIAESGRKTDEEAREIMKGICKCNQPSAFQKLPYEKQVRAIERMREELSIRQIARITGVSTEIVRKYKAR